MKVDLDNQWNVDKLHDEVLGIDSWKEAVGNKCPILGSVAVSTRSGHRIG